MILIDTDHLSVLSNRRSAAHLSLVQRMTSSPDQEFAIPVICVEEQCRGWLAADFKICRSVGLYAEWQDVLTRPEHLPPGQGAEGALAFLRYLAGQAWLQEIYFLWRPFLPHPNDDMILELAFAARCPCIVTHNLRHFKGCEQLGIRAMTPGEFMKLIRESRGP